MKPNYWSYIRVEELLSLQNGLGDREPEKNEEVMFIVVHQIDELWFKLILRELKTVRDLFRQSHVPETALARAARSLKRVCILLRLAAEHFALMETMTPRDFLDFRDKLVPASGFQSAQFREMEILLGLGMELRVPFGREGSYTSSLRAESGGSPALERVRRREGDRPYLREAIEQWLLRTPIEGSQPDETRDREVVDHFLERFLERHRADLTAQMRRIEDQTLTHADVDRLKTSYETEMKDAEVFLRAPDFQRRRIRAAILFIESYRELPLLSWPREILDLVVEMEQSLLIFRQRHARMVERMIGRRVGTGGSSGVDYLDATAIKYRIFEDVWAVRTLLLREASIPPLANASFYEFRAQ